MADPKGMKPLPETGEEIRKWKVEAAGEVEPDINVTPLVDISLVLVIIFLVTSPFLTERDIMVVANKKPTPEAIQIVKQTKLSLDITLDKKSHEPIAALKEEILDPATHKKTVDLKKYAIGDDLGTAIHAKVANYAKDDNVLYLNPANDVLHGDVVKALDLAKQNGVLKLSFVPLETPEPASRQE